MTTTTTTTTTTGWTCRELIRTLNPSLGRPETDRPAERREPPTDVNTRPADPEVFWTTARWKPKCSAMAKASGNVASPRPEHRVL
jgi:hypothetical protein